MVHRPNAKALRNTVTTVKGGMGREISADLEVMEIMREAGLDWRVETRPLYFLDKNGDPVKSKDMSLVRTDNDHEFDTVSGDWHPNQNEDFFGMIEEFKRISNKAMRVTHAGHIKKGALVWALATIDEEFTVLGKDRVQSQILFSNPNKYGKSIDIRFSPTRLFCSNQLNMSLTGKFKSELCVKISHRAEFNPQVVFDTLNLAGDRLKDYKETAELLSSKRFTKENLMSFYGDVLGRKPQSEQLSKPAQTALDVLDTQPGAAYGEGTWWQAVNSVTYMTNHLSGRTDENRLESLWYGPNRKKNLVAFNTAIKYANAA